MESISVEELKTHVNDQGAHIRYLLRLGVGKNGAFKSMAEMARHFVGSRMNFSMFDLSNESI